jgi:hypothetical protein
MTQVPWCLYKNLLSLLDEVFVLQRKWDNVGRLHKDFPGFALGDVFMSLVDENGKAIALIY